MNVGTTGQALVSGRLLAEITRSLPPHPVDIALDGSRLSITCASARFTLPTMPVEDYPRLPDMPTTAGKVDGSVFATAVAQAAVAAGRDDTLPMLTGVRLEIDGEKLTLAATDRYRLAVRELEWQPTSNLDVQVLVPARALADAAKSLAGHDELTIALSTAAAGGTGEGIIGFSATGHETTTRLLDAQFPPYRTLLPSDWASSAEVSVSAFTESVKRVALLADRGTPVRLEFADGGVVAVGRRRERRTGRRGARGRLRGRADHDRVQPGLPDRRPGRGRRRHRPAAVHLGEQAGRDPAGRCRARSTTRT